MKRGLLVMAALALLAGTTWGDYLIIKINLGATQESPESSTPPPPGGGPGLGGPGAGGGPPGMGPGGMGPSKGSGKGGRGGYGPGMGGPGMPPGGGAGGPGMPPGGSPPGSGQRNPGGGGRPPGGAGGPGMPPGGGPGGGPGFGGGPNFGGGPPGMNPGAPSSSAPASDQKPNWFIATVDADLFNRKTKDIDMIKVTSQWGHTDVDLTQLSKNKVVISQEKYNLAQQFDAHKAKLMKEDPFKFGEWMLQHWSLPVTDDQRFGFDMRKRFEEYIDELAKVVQKNDAKASARLQALLSTRDQLRKPLPGADDELGRIRPIVGDDARTMARDHYVILHPPRSERIAEQKHKRLEHAYAAFYYWFALQGQTLPAPAKQLIVVLAEDVDKFTQLHKIFDSLPLSDDGFYSALDNVLVLAAGRIDSQFQEFQSIANDLEKELSASSPGITLKKLREGTTIPKKDMEGADIKALAFGRVVALAQVAAEAEGEISTITYEVTQQLAAATGLLPRRVQVPLAVRMGLGSFFETIRSNGDWEAPSLWSGAGSANHWLYLPLFRKLKEAEKSGSITLDADRKAKIQKPNILRIIGDQDFLAAERADAAERDVKRDTARAEAWALTFYLARERLPNLLRFYQELSRLPRDMELTPDVVEHAFAIAFELQDAKDSNKVDQEKVARLDKEWRAYMDYQQLEINPATAPSSDKKAKK